MLHPVLGFRPLVGNNVLIVAHASSLEACTRQLQGRSPLSPKDFIQIVRKVRPLLASVCFPQVRALLSNLFFFSDSVPGVLFLPGAGRHGGVAAGGPPHPPPHAWAQPQLRLERDAAAGMTSLLRPTTEEEKDGTRRL